MKRAAIVLALLLVPSAAHAAPGDDLRETARAARAEGEYTFCSKPSKTLLGREWRMCPLAREVDDCEAFAQACDEHFAEKAPRAQGDFFESLAKALGSITQVLAFALVGLILLLVAIPVVLAVAKARRDRQLGDDEARAKNVAQPLAPTAAELEEITDAEAALRRADDLARRGDHERAIALYLAASLSALDHRGAIRIAKHRTNGEYVRACSEQASRQPLREIVREVDRAVYGKVAPTRESVARVASRAQSVVRAVAMALLLLGCGGASGLLSDKADPAGDGLPMDVLRRSGFTVSHLSTSLATLPMPGEDNAAPPVVVVPGIDLEEESEAHLMRWVEAGGFLVLMGSPSHWPKDLEAKRETAGTRDLHVDYFDADERKVRLRGARVAHADAIDWHEAEPLAKLGDHVYAARKFVGSGAVIGVANADLFTNVAMAKPDNAAALVTVLRLATSWRNIGVAREEDGIPPPGNPFASLVRAGLGKGAAHGLAACILLFLAFGIRQARPRPARAPARRAFAEHVEATGAFYGRTRAHAHALAAYGKYVETRLRERVPRGADPVAFLASRSGLEKEHVARVYARAMEGGGGDELATLRDLRPIVATALET